ncbi:MAG: hypothetical protein NTY90_01310 [Candidatus Micrarchaeota archaeon]|nr:hypothetical protein [Candidatus Micrarchaeota archaeon]
MEEDYQQAVAQAQAERAAEMQRRAMLKQVLDGAAFERMTRIRMSNPELYLKIFKLLIYLYQNGQLKATVGEEELKALAAKLVEKKHEPSITRLQK